MGWIVSCSTYLGAKVPLIKLELDPAIPFCATKRKCDYLPAPHPTFYLDSASQNLSQIKIDLTLSNDFTCNSPSTELMRTTMENNPTLQRVIIALKYVLAGKGYN